MSFARRLRYIRKETRLTQSQVAQKIGTTADMVRKLENGSTRPSKHILKRCADVFGLNQDFFTGKDATDKDLASELKDVKKKIASEKQRKIDAARESDIERRKEELTKRVAPPDAIGATLRIKKSEADEKKEEEKKKSEKKTPLKDDFSFEGFGGSSPDEKVYEEDPDLLTTIPVESAGEPPLIGEVEEEEREPTARRHGKFRDAADGESVTFDELTKAVGKSKKPKKKPQTLDEMVHELIKRQNALIRLLIDKKIISKKDFRERLK